VAPLTDEVGKQRVGGPCCLYLHGESMAAEMLVYYHITTRRHNTEDCNLNPQGRENLKSRTKLRSLHVRRRRISWHKTNTRNLWHILGTKLQSV